MQRISTISSRIALSAHIRNPILLSRQYFAQQKRLLCSSASSQSSSSQAASVPSSIPIPAKYANDPILKQIHLDVNEYPCVLYMKGVPSRPMCGFSQTVVRILNQEGASYASYDVLSDEELREGIKTYSDWPTIPQLYLNGEFIGGCDIMLDLHKSGELNEMLDKAGVLMKKKDQ
eukprot:TRINITY_DN12604_c0_g1_i1.p1 TRINITY_DN12604_c0_g1~~TRINITY_DN12604_c0_g1_i1.p1  ORF type:complete len:175 (-),score=73.09 TRINITY_DN12604_c0_g1_i1:131-655(-)